MVVNILGDSLIQSGLRMRTRWVYRDFPPCGFLGDGRNGLSGVQCPSCCLPLHCVQCPSCCLPEEGPDRTETLQEKFDCCNSEALLRDSRKRPFHDL